ncbi:MAG: hypothetical protein HXN55_10085 [Prevotella nigrescens]|uniref:Rad50/SbcC-type AAA domain-containing protein n=1 Tax=Prevotella nigrescens TaxID=28133 RepID=A0A9D5X1A7_9BACT|nr:hypothetical protein [Prevotella nigrescens]MBF1447712.1 hypothetical protein [Prevotella nigrescens]
MTWKIDSIKIKNFKFFNEEFLLKLDGKNLLLYGENGSGKSSIYWSFYTHLQACLKNNEQASKYFIANHSENLRNRFSHNDEEAGIKVTYVEIDSGVKTILNSSSNGSYINDIDSLAFMQRNLKSCDFMNYKFLSSIFDFRNSQDNDIYKIFEKEIFQYLPLTAKLFNSSFPILSSTSAEEYWKEIKRNIGKIPTSNSGRYLVSSDEHKKVLSQIVEFNDMLENALKTLTLTANIIIKNKFNLDVELKVKYEKATFNNLVNNIGKQRNQKLRNPRIILNAIMTHPQIIDNTCSFLKQVDYLLALNLV